MHLDFKCNWGKNGQMNIAYGFAIILIVLVGCFAFLIYQNSQLQSQVNTIQQQQYNTKKPNIVVLSYSWTDEPNGPSENIITVNCTVLNASPVGATDFSLAIYAQFATETPTSSWDIPSGIGPWQTRNVYNLTETYNIAYGNLENVWVEPQLVTAAIP